MAEHNHKNFEFVSLTGGDQGLFIKCFQNTSLRSTAYVKIATIDEMLRFNITDKKLHIFYWEYNDIDGKTSQTWERLESKDRLNLKQLINDCEEVREYVKITAPQFTI